MLSTDTHRNGFSGGEWFRKSDSYPDVYSNQALNGYSNSRGDGRRDSRLTTDSDDFQHISGSVKPIRNSDARTLPKVASISRSQTSHGMTSQPMPFQIIESTLREGEQFANAFFDTETKIQIAKALDSFGVGYIELTSPAASEQSFKDCQTIARLGLKAKILTHVRCNMDDARLAIQAGVDGVNIVMGTSKQLMKHSHGKDMNYIISTAKQVIKYVKSQGKEVRFSSEDSFRSNLVDLLELYREVDKAGVDRVGVADTIGCASPRQVYDLIRTLRSVVGCDIETHFHNDTGCAIANAFCALEAGATHIDTTVLGVGERNGITSLGGLIARMVVADPDGVRSIYKLKELKGVEDLVAQKTQISIPFNNPVTGFCAFNHKAGIHAKAILNDPSTYEVLQPSDFGVDRHIDLASRLTGWNAIKSRAVDLNLELDDAQARKATVKIKALADVRQLAIDDIDSILQQFCNEQA